MTTRMVHPLHGAMHAYDAGEVEKLKGAGWCVETLPAVELSTVVEVQEPVKRKPGRPAKAK